LGNADLFRRTAEMPFARKGNEEFQLIDHATAR